MSADVTDMSTSPAPRRRAALFRNGRNQAVRIPREFELNGTEVLVIKDGERLILEPIRPRGRLLAVLAEMEPLAEEFPDLDEGLGHQRTRRCRRGTRLPSRHQRTVASHARAKWCDGGAPRTRWRRRRMHECGRRERAPLWSHAAWFAAFDSGGRSDSQGHPDPSAVQRERDDLHQ